MLVKLAITTILSLGLLFSAKVQGQATFTFVAPEQLNHDVIDLKGTWMLAWEKLIEPSQLQETMGAFQPTQVPGVWGAKTFPDRVIPKTGYGTYFLKVSLPQDYPRLTLRIPELPSNYRLYIDGNLVREKGKVGINAETSKAGRGTEFVEFVPGGRDIQLVLQTSSFYHREGGIWNSFQLAKADVMAENRLDRVTFDAFLLGILAIMSSYHLSLFLLRRKDKSSLYFAMFCCTVLLRVLATSDYGFFSKLAPGLDSEWSKRAELLIILVGAPLFFSFFCSNYRQHFSPRIEKGLWALGGLGALVLLFTQQRIYGYLLLPYEIVILAGFSIGIWNLSRAIRQGRTGSLLSLCGILIFFATAINDVLHTNLLIHTTLMLPIGFSLYILMQALVIAKRFSAAFIKVEADEKIISELNKKLEFQIVRLDEIVEQKTSHIKSIFQTIHQAIFTIDRDGVISEERSHFTDTILKGATTIRELLDSTEATGEEKSYVESILIGSVGTEEFTFEANLHLLLRRMRRGDEVYELDWSPILNTKDDTVSSLLVCLRDVTEIEKLREETQRKDSRILILAELIGAPATQQQKNIESLHKIMKRIDGLIDRPNVQRELLVELHTFKGNSRFFGFKSLSNTTHSVESEILRDPTLSRSVVVDLRSTFAEYKQIFDKNIGVHLNEGVMHVDRAILEGLYKYFSIKSDLSPTESMFLDRLERELHSRLDTLIDAQTVRIRELATRLGKDHPEIKVSGKSMVVPENYSDTLMKMLNHLLRNSLDHGLETPAERFQVGKDPQGHIDLLLRQKNGFLELDYWDDGRGYDLQGIRRKASTLGIKTDGLNDDQVVALTALPQFSTKSDITDVSGRGVGMDAVVLFARELGGDLLFHVNEVEGDFAKVTLTIRLPAMPVEALKKSA